MDPFQSLRLVSDLTELDEALKLMRRDDAGGKKCKPCQAPKCTTCPSHQVCQFTVPLDCTTCASAICTKDESADSSGSSDSKGSGPNAGAIAGGVIGGVAVIAILTYLVWKYIVKPKRNQLGTSMYNNAASDVRDSEKDAQSRMTKRSSTHTIHSIASTVLTRASNIIQIAYIPGVTNRSGPSHDNNTLVPPVPPIPMQHTEAGRHARNQQEEQHFFVPGDLRNSAYSDFSQFSSDRTSYARTSYAPRSSIASTIYGKQAQVQVPAQAGLRVKPTMVSVKSSPNSTPPVPSIDFEKFSNNNRPRSGMSTFSVGSTFLNNANTAQQARAQVVKVGGGGLRTVEIGSKNHSNATSPATASPASKSRGDTQTPTIVEEGLGPFSDPPLNSSPQSVNTSILESATDMEAGSMRSRRSLDRPGSSQRGGSPFGDEHVAR